MAKILKIDKISGNFQEAAAQADPASPLKFFKKLMLAFNSSKAALASLDMNNPAPTPDSAYLP